MTLSLLVGILKKGMEEVDLSKEIDYLLLFAYLFIPYLIPRVLHSILQKLVQYNIFR